MFIIFFLRFYLFIHRDTHREAETPAEGEAGSTQRARRGTRSRVSRIMPWAAGGAKPLRHRGCPTKIFFKDFIHSFMRDKERERQRHRQREKQAPRREPDMGLDPRSPGSHPGLQVALNCYATGAALSQQFVILSLGVLCAGQLLGRQFSLEARRVSSGAIGPTLWPHPAPCLPAGDQGLFTCPFGLPFSVQEMEADSSCCVSAADPPGSRCPGS